MPKCWCYVELPHFTLKGATISFPFQTPPLTHAVHRKCALKQNQEQTFSCIYFLDMWRMPPSGVVDVRAMTLNVFKIN